MSSETPRQIPARVAHDLRNPLTGILGYADLLAAGGVVDEDSRRSYAATILAEAIRLRDMINDLEAGRPNAGPAAPAPAEDEHRVVNSGAADVLSKPFSREGLLDSVALVLDGGPASILIVDDDPTIRALMVTTLEREGLDLRQAADGVEALARISERRPDVILLDLEMPVLDGFGVLDKLRNDFGLRSIPVIVLTARDVTPGERARLRDQTVAFRQKSAYTGDELRELVGNVLP